MLSKIEEPDTEIRFPEQGQEILEILRTSGEWMSRSEIAKILGKKNTINPQEMAYMEVMQLNGLIESKQVDSTTPTGWQWVYRAKAIISDSE